MGVDPQDFVARVSQPQSLPALRFCVNPPIICVFFRRNSMRAM